jgi:TIR domain-containing protein
MTEPVALKYRAFISYSHADTAQAKWLHRGLESCRIDGDLAGRETKSGPIPKTIKPIFRDRDDFTAGHTLTEQTLAALDASSALIVLCSPAAAKSHYVNEEIRLFKQRHPKRSVVPLIVDGKPGDPERECFPPALKFKVDAKGRIGKKPLELLAADAREEGDGKALALAKVIAGLLDVTSDEVFRRSERERRRKARVRNGVIGVLAFLSAAAIGSAAYAWQQLKTNEAFLYATLKTATSFVDDAVTQAEKYGVPRTATLSLLTRAEGLFDTWRCSASPRPSCAIKRHGC